jgi:hypothetical protein
VRVGGPASAERRRADGKREARHEHCEQRGAGRLRQPAEAHGYGVPRSSLGSLNVACDYAHSDKGRSCRSCQRPGGAHDATRSPSSDGAVAPTRRLSIAAQGRYLVVARAPARQISIRAAQAGAGLPCRCWCAQRVRSLLGPRTSLRDGATPWPGAGRRRSPSFHPCTTPVALRDRTLAGTSRGRTLPRADWPRAERCSKRLLVGAAGG